MRKGFFGSLTALLAGSSLALAQPPAATDPAAHGGAIALGQPTAVPPGPDAGTAAGDWARSPYWPNPLSKFQPFCPPALAHDVAGEDKPHEQLVVWGGVEYLLWWVKNQSLGVPLVTTGGAGLGVLGAADTAVLFGNSDIDYHTFSGGRFTLGLGLGTDRNCDWGVEGSGFLLEKRPSSFLASSSANGIPLLARPIISAPAGTETALLVAAPGVLAGNVAVDSHSNVFGWDVDLVHGFYCDGPLRVELLGGFRYLNLDEDINIGQSSMLVPNGPGTAGFVGNTLVPPTTVAVFDHFGTRNEFYGGQLGARVLWARERLVVSALGKIGLGSIHEVVSLGGFTSQVGNAMAPGLVPSGLLVLASNSGARAHDEFAAVPEIGINVGYQILPCLRAFVGYTFLYISDVARPGDQINRTVNLTTVPLSRTFPTPSGPAEPSFAFQRTDFWAQGVNFGFELHF